MYLNLSDFNEIVECAITNLQVEIEKNSAIVTHDQLPTFLADPIQIIQLFQNLIGNSIKFREKNLYVFIYRQSAKRMNGLFPFTTTA